MKIKELVQDYVARPRWGFVPSREVKPVHFANKFFRALCDQKSNPELLHRATALRKPGAKHVSSEMLLAEESELFEGANHSRAVEKVDQIRALLHLVLNQDRGVYPSSSTYSFTLTHRAMSSSDRSDQQTGRFLVDILAEREDGRAIPALRRALADASDPITKLAEPFLPDETIGDFPSPPSENSIEAKLLQSSSLLKHLQQAFETLAGHQENLEKTEFLRRAVTLGAFGLVAHVLNSTDEARDGTLVPIVICAKNPLGDVREASRSCLRHGLSQIDLAFEEELAALLEARGEADRDQTYYRRLMEDWLDTAGLKSTIRKKVVKARGRFENDFRLELAGGTDPFTAFLRAAVPTAFTVIGANSPHRFALALGRLCGLFYPRAQGRGDKYALPTPPFYDTLISALMSPSEELPARDFWRRAHERFGLLVGADHYHDIDHLASCGIRVVSERSLAANAASVDRELEKLGHGRRYSDGFSLIRAAH